jgi:hypothetical protein
MKRFLSLLTFIVLVVVSTGCAAPKQKEIDAINELFAGTDSEVYSVKYNPSSEIIEVVAPIEGINTMLADYLTGDELSVANWNSLKEVMPEAESYILTHLSDLGYSSTISLSFSDSLSPDVPLLTSQGGKIIYEATEVPAEPSTASSPATNNSQSRDSDEALDVIESFLPQLNSKFETYTVRYNGTTGVIEVFNAFNGMADMLNNTLAGRVENSIDWNSTREAMITNCNLFDSLLADNNYSVPVSLSLSDSKEPDKPLLTIMDGKIVYDVAESEIVASSSGDPSKAVAALEEFVKDMQNDINTYTVNYNEATGVIEVFSIISGLSGMLGDSSAGESSGSIDWDSCREAAIVNSNTFVSVTSGIGYSGPVSISFSDSETPDKPLLTAQNGEIIYDVFE